MARCPECDGPLVKRDDEFICVDCCESYLSDELEEEDEDGDDGEEKDLCRGN